MNIKNFTLVLAFCGLSALAVAQPAAPVLLSPSDTATSVSRTPLLDWDTLTADSFSVMLSTQMDMSSPVISVYSDTTEYQVMTNLNYSTTYYWTVAGIDVNGTGSTSDTFSFTVMAKPANLPDDPTLKSPTTGSLGLPRKPTLEWNTANGATQYRVHVAEYINFGDTAYHAIVTGTSHTLTIDLKDYTVYYWRVVAENNDGLSDWSNFWNFTTLYTGVGSLVKADFDMSIYPNPSSIKTSLRFEMKEAGNALVQVLDVNGKVVQNVMNNSLEAGSQEVSITTSELKSGIYFVQVNAGGAAQMMKLLVN